MMNKDEVREVLRMTQDIRDLAGKIDHTQLKPDTTQEMIEKLCEEATAYRFATVCVNPFWVSFAKERVGHSGVGVTTVIGFPLGAATSHVKALEAAEALRNGATEIDMVMNIGALKSGKADAVKADIAAVVNAVRDVKTDAVVKVILETALLNQEEKRRACLLAKEAGADFVKTSTGFGPGGATVEDIRLMRDTVGPKMGVKASGGVRDRAFAQALIEAGASRIGASSSVAIVEGVKGTSSY